MHILFCSGDKSRGFHYFKKIKSWTLILVHSSACHLSSHQTVTAVEQNVCCFCQCFVNATFQMIYFAYIAPAHQLTFTLFPPFFPFLSTLVSHFIPNFPLHLLASHSALPPNSSPSLPPCRWSPAAQNITQGQRCLFLYLLASLFQGCTPSALQHILHLKDFWLKQSELKVQKLLPRQNLLLE